MPNKFWIKERLLPGNKPFYIACGELTEKQAKALDRAKFGVVAIIDFPNKDEYLAKLQSYRDQGLTVIGA